MVDSKDENRDIDLNSTEGSGDEVIKSIIESFNFHL